MSGKALTNFKLPPKIAYHAKMLVAGIFITGFFNLLWSGSLIPNTSLVTLAFVVVQMELFLVIALRIFSGGREKFGTNYKKRIITRLLIFYLIVVAVGTAFVFLAIAVPMLFTGGNYSDMLDGFLSDGLQQFLLSWLISLSIASVAFFYMEWNNALNRERKLREEKLIFQYESLKNKVNPHFLFNSLNTLSSLIPRDPELSERFITKFSTIYRYVLENADRDMVGLDEELGFIDDFFFLQKIRDDGKINLHVKVDNAQRYSVIPVSIQLLVENALKHNAASREHPLSIKIYLENDDTLIVENNVQKKISLEASAKVGLKNLRERVILAMVKEIIIQEGPENFLVKLPILKKEA